MNGRANQLIRTDIQRSREEPVEEYAATRAVREVRPPATVATTGEDLRAGASSFPR